MSSRELPNYTDLMLQDYPRVHGFYILGMLKILRPDVTWVTPDQWHSYKDCSWLNEIIQRSLDNKKPVALVPWDEGLLACTDTNLGAVVNQYHDQPVWLISQLDSQDHAIYSNQFKLNCKILELPWFLLNDTLSYYLVCSNSVVNMSDRSKYNYLCMLGRYESHKFEMALALRKKNLHNYGLITVSDPNKYPEENRGFCVPNPCPPQDAVASNSLPGLRAGAHNKHDSVWISGNVKNYLYLEQTYKDIPLIVHPDTTCGIFQNTEKVLWPLLLGRLMLVFGRPGVMKSIQKWYDVDFGEYANLTFDNHCGDWTVEAHQQRLDMLLDHNAGLITDAAKIHQHLQDKLQSARWTIGKNLYKFFVGNLDKLQSNTRNE